MTPMQRLGAVLCGEKQDRPPYGLVCGSMGAVLTSCTLEDYYQDPGLYAKGQAALCDILDPDIIFSPFLFAYEAAAFGAKLAPQARSVPNVAKPPYRSVEEALAAPMPSLRGDSYLRYLIEATEASVALVRGERMVAAPIVSPVDLPALLIGIEAWLDALLFKPEEAALLNARAMEHFVALGSAYLAAGAAMLATPVMFVNPAILDPANMKRLTLPILHEAFSRMPGPIVFHHGGTSIAEHIGLYEGLPKLAGFVLGERDSFSVARAAVGPDMILMGNISGPHFEAYSPERLRQKLDALIEDRREDKRWIFCNASAELPSWTPIEQLVIVREAFQGTKTLRQRETPPATKEKPIPLIACSIFREEFAALANEVQGRYAPVYLDSMLHMRPLELDSALHALLDAQCDSETVLLYGDCCPFMRDMAEAKGRSRTEGINCCEIMLGPARYKALRKEGAFFLMHEWTERWEEVFKYELGFKDTRLAKSFMKDSMKKLVYIDTGLHPVPSDTLAAIERYFDLPMSVERVGLEHFEEALRQALTKARP